MRKLNLVCGMLLLFSVLGYGQEKKEVVDGYVIHGVIDGEYHGNKVDLVKEASDGTGLIVVDSAVVENNRYTFKGPNVKATELYFIQSRDKESTSPRTEFFLENGMIKIRSNAKFFSNNDVRGTVNNDIYVFHKFLENCVTDSLKRAFLLNIEINGEKSEAEELEGLKQRSELMNRRMTDIGEKIVAQYPDQVYASYVMNSQLRYTLPLGELKTMRASLSQNLNDCIYTKSLDEFIQFSEFKEGSMMPKFELPDQTGKMVSLEKFKGKYVLIDFWASWCGPCLREMPNVVKLYKGCKGANFEIIGISLDNNKEAWLDAIKKNNMKWTQLCDFKAWMSAPAKQCGVKAIPQTILVDPTGKVIAIGLRGEQLFKKVREVLDK